MTNFWLIRHGQTDWNLAGRWQGQAQFAPALNGTGRVQALALRNQFEKGCFSALYSSDLLRSHQTAELLAAHLGLTINLEPRLREMHLGLWEGMRSDEITAQFPQQLMKRARDPWNTRAPEGESPREVAARVIPAMDQIAEKHCGETVLIVGHAISLAVIICHAHRIPLDQVYENIPDNTKPFHVAWRTPHQIVTGMDHIRMDQRQEKGE